MTKQEALDLKTFDHYCTCGGFACSINGRDPRNPHMAWCPQMPQYVEWYEALHSKDQS